MSEVPHQYEVLAGNDLSQSADRLVIVDRAAYDKTVEATRPVVISRSDFYDLKPTGAGE